ncbi:MAG: hypothetical protein OSA45_05175 [Halioglobus sp.]|nr:hypothetical protein [Halioglobus sp.]
MRLPLLLVALPLLLCACGGYEIKNLMKTDIDLVTDEFIIKTRGDVRELVIKLYKRNPDQLRKIPGMTVEGRLAQLRVHRYQLEFPELDGKQDVAAMNLAFDPNFHGDRVFALVVGLGSMLREAYGYQPEMFLPDQLSSEVLLASARNVEVLLWKLKNTLKPDGHHYIITHEYQGVVDNLSFERLFGEIIVLQEMMAQIADDSGDRAVTSAVHAISKVFIPLPL